MFCRSCWFKGKLEVGSPLPHRLGMLAETSSETVTEEEDPAKGAEGGAYAEDDSFCSQLVEANEVKEEEDGGPTDVCCNELAVVLPMLVNILDYVSLKHYEESFISPWLFQAHQGCVIQFKALKFVVRSLFIMFSIINKYRK